MPPLKVLFVTPPYHSGVVESAGTWPPLAFVYLAGAVRAKGHVPLIYDAMSRFEGQEAIRSRIALERPDVVAVTAFTAAVPSALEVLRGAKEIDPRTTTLLGGVHPTFQWREILEAPESPVDFVVRGEGEEVLPSLLECVAERGDPSGVAGIAYRVDGRARGTPPAPFLRDLDAIPAAWDLLDWPLYSYRPSPEGRLAVVSSSRGCPKGCTFCSQQVFWKRTWRGRAPEAFVDELEMLRGRFDVRVAMICDELPTAQRARWERILALLLDRRLGIEILMETRVDDLLRDEDLLDRYRGAGVGHLYTGVESGRQEALDLFQKGIRVEESKRAIDLINRHDIVSETSFVLGLPGDTPETFREAVDLALYYAPDMAFFLALAPWPYAEIRPQMEPYLVERDYARYNLVEPVLAPPGMTLGEVRRGLEEATMRFFHRRFRDLSSLSPGKRDYLLKVLRILLEHSYLSEHIRGAMKGGGGDRMPLEVRRLLGEVPALASGSSAA